MLALELPKKEFFDEETQNFITYESLTLELEHSLVSLSKWESKFEKPFLDSRHKTDEESFYYIYCMILTQNVSENVLSRLTPQQIQQINTYVDSKMTATTFQEEKHLTKKNQEIITAELVYYWMVTLNIPMECQYWHLNRLFTLIKVFSVKNSKPKKMSKSEMLARNRSLNAKRKAELGTSG